MTAAESSATISSCGRYRYRLERRIPDVIGPALCWLMLNPSTADASKDDPTIRKVIGFTKRGGYGSAVVVNLFALRETEPKKVRTQLAVAEGPDNLATILRASVSSDAMVCAWGAQPWAREQARAVLEWLLFARATPPRFLCLGRTKDGDPLHPLMPSYDGHPLVPFSGMQPRGTAT